MILIACVAWRFWLGVLSNKRGRAEKPRGDWGGLDKCYARYDFDIGCSNVHLSTHLSVGPSDES